MRYATDAAACLKVRAVAIVDSTGDLKGKLIAHCGPVRTDVTLWDWTGESPTVQSGSASGYGYNKLNAAIAGMTFNGKELSEGYDLGKQVRELGFTAHQLL